MADYKIQVGINLDTTNLQDKINEAVNKQKLNITAALNINVADFQKTISALQDNVRINVDDKEISELQSKIANITKEISIFNGKGLQTGFVENFNTGLGKSQQNIYEINNKTKTLQLAVSKLTTDHAAINREKEKELKLTEEITAKQNQLNGIVEKLKLGSFGKSDIDSIDEIAKKINDVSLSAKSSIPELAAYQKELGKVVASSKFGEIKSDSGLSFKSSQSELQSYLQSLFNVEKQLVQIKDKVKIINLSDGEQWKQQTAIIQNGQGQWEKYVVSINSVSDALRIVKEGIVNVNSNLSNTEEILKARLQSKIDTFKTSLTSSIDNLKVGGLSDVDLQKANTLQIEIQKLSADTKNAEQEMKRLGITYKSLIGDLKSGRLVDVGNTMGLKTSDAELRSYIAGLRQVDAEQVKIANSSKIAFGKNGEQIRIVNALVQEGTNEWRRYQYAINTASQETRELDKGIQSANTSHSALASQVKSLISLYFSLTMAIRLIRQALSEMKDADTELITIQKVSKRNTEEMNKLLQDSFTVATDYGRKSKEYLNAVAEFTKGGYGNAADELGKLSLLTQNAGDVTNEQANKFLLAADAAWKLNGDINELTKILDGFNDVANNNATDVGKLADGIYAAGSFFAAAGLEAKDYAGIVGTATTVTQQSGDEMGRAWRTILMNIRQMKGETAEGEIIDDKQLAKAEKALKNVDIAVREYRKGINELRDPMKVLGELAGKWDTLNSVQKSMIEESLAGKMRANALIAVMENWDKVIKMQGEYENASGSAMRENELYINSWVAKLNQLEAAWVQFVAKTIDSSWIKGLFSAGTSLLKLLGSLGTAVSLLSGAYLLLKKNSIADSIYEQIKSLKLLVEIVKAAVAGNLQQLASEKAKAAALAAGTAATNTATAATTSLGLSINAALGIVGLLITAFNLVTIAVNGYKASQEEARQKALEHARALMTEKASLDDIAQKYAEISESANRDKDARKQLSDIQNTLIEQYGIEAGSIDLVNGKYDENIKKINELRLAKLQAVIDENKIIAEKSHGELNKKSHGNPVVRTMYNDFGDSWQYIDENKAIGAERIAIEEYIAALEDMRKRLNEKRGEFEKTTNEDRERFAADLNKRINSARDVLAKNRESVKTVEDAITEFNKISIASANSFSKDREKLFRILSGSVKLDITNETAYTARLNKIAEEIKAIPVEKFSELREAYQDYQKAIATSDNKLLESSMQKIKDLRDEVLLFTSGKTSFKNALNEIFDISEYEPKARTLFDTFKDIMDLFAPKTVTTDNILQTSIEQISTALENLRIDTAMFDGVTSSILNMKAGFDEGRISADDFFTALNAHISNVDFNEMFGGDTASIQKYFTALSSEVSSSLEKVVGQFSSGKTLASDYAKNIASTAQSYNGLIDKLVEGNKVWGNNSEELEKNAAALKTEQTEVNSSVKTLSEIVPALEAIENISAETVKKGSDEWKEYYTTISDTLAGIVADSETMLYDVNGNLLTTSSQICNALINNTLSFETASETIMEQANTSIQNIGKGIGTFLNVLSEEIKNFKFTFAITPRITFSKDNISPLLPFPAPEVSFDFKVTDSGSMGNIIDAFSGLADVVTDNLPKISIDDLISSPKDLLEKNGSGGGKNKSSKSGGSSKKEFEETLNFADKAIANISQRITELRQQLENAVELEDKNTILDAIIGAEQEKIQILQQAINLYNSEANKALEKIPKDLQKSAVEGSINLTTIKDEKVKKAIDEYNKWSDASVKLKNEISGINKEINGLTTEKFENLNKKFENSLKPLQDAIAETDFKLKLLGDTDYESKIGLLNKQFEEQGKILSRTSDELKNIQTLYQSGQIMAAQFKDRTDSLNKAWQDGVIAANGYSKAIQDVNRAQAQAQLSQHQKDKSSVNALVEMTKNLLRQQANDQIKAIQDEINGYNEAKKALQEKGKQLDEQLQLQRKIVDAQRKAIDNEIKHAKELADAEKKRLNDKLKAYEKVISKAKQALDIEKEQYSYQNDLDSKQGDIAKLENRIAELSNDTSRAGIVERQKLEEELAKKRKELADFVFNNDVDKRKNALDAELQMFKDTISNELELNDDKLNRILSGYDKQKEALNDVYEKFADNVKREKDLLDRQAADYDRLAENRKSQIDKIQDKISNNAELTRQAMQKIDKDGEKLYDDLIKWNYEYGTGIERDVKDAWEAAKNVLLQYNSTLMSTIQLTERISDLNREIAQMEARSYSGGYNDGGRTVGVRQILESAGYNVGWDDQSKSIIVDGKSYDSSGFQNINGTLYGTEDDVINMLKSLGLWRGSLAIGGKIREDGFAQVHAGEEVVKRDTVAKAEPVVAKVIDSFERFANLSATFGEEVMDKLKNVLNFESDSRVAGNIMSGVRNSLPVQNSFRRTEINIDAPVTIEGNVAENTLPSLKKILDTQRKEIVGEITKNLAQGGIKASVKSFSQ